MRGNTSAVAAIEPLGSIRKNLEKSMAAKYDSDLLA
jgi:hypothetical protein